MTAALIIAACLVIGGIIVAVVRKRRKDHAARTAAATAPTSTDPYAQTFSGGNPQDIKIGDLIGGLFDTTHGSELRTVRGSVSFQDGGYRWTEHFLESGDFSPKQYLSVERETGVVVTIFWTSLPAIPGVRPGESLSFIHDGVGYERDEKGKASYTTIGTTDDLLAGGTVRYCDYRGDDGSRISFEKFDDGEWECSYGEAVVNLTIYPKP